MVVSDVKISILLKNKNQLVVLPLVKRRSLQFNVWSPSEEKSFRRTCDQNSGLHQRKVCKIKRPVQSVCPTLKTWKLFLTIRLYVHQVSWRIAPKSNLCCCRFLLRAGQINLSESLLSIGGGHDGAVAALVGVDSFPVIVKGVNLKDVPSKCFIDRIAECNIFCLFPAVFCSETAFHMENTMSGFVDRCMIHRVSPFLSDNYYYFRCISIHPFWKEVKWKLLVLFI